jgi:serine/threonine protein kinase
MLGGSYIINSIGNIKTCELIVYPEVSILLDKKIGEGGSGSVTKGIIVKCAKNDKLIGKSVAIKSFFESDQFTSEAKKKYEKDKMLEYHLDENDTLIENENPYIASLYFDITNGPLKDQLVYEYGGNILCTYIGSPNYNLENNKRIMKQLFTILYELSQRDNMHNDIKCDNTVYDIDSNNNIHIKLIDFGSCVRISLLNNNTINFQRRTNMNTPETIFNHLINNQEKLKTNQNLTLPFTKADAINLNNFNRWYYYPFISIVYFLFTGIEYSTGSLSYIKKKIEDKDDMNINELIKSIGDINTKEKIKLLTYIILLNNDTYIKTHLKNNINHIFRDYLPILYTLIDGMCKPTPSMRISEDAIIELLSK